MPDSPPTEATTRDVLEKLVDSTLSLVRSHDPKIIDRFHAAREEARVHLAAFPSKPAFVPTSHEPVEGVELWNSDESWAEDPTASALIVVDAKHAGIISASGIVDDGYRVRKGCLRRVDNFTHTPVTLTAFRDKVRAERAAAAKPSSPPTPHEQAIGAEPKPEDWSKLTTPKKREVTLWNFQSQSPSCAAHVGGKSAWISSLGEISSLSARHSYSEATMQPNAWPLPAGTGERLDAYFDSLESAPARPDSGEGGERWTQDDLRDVALRVKMPGEEHWRYVTRVGDHELYTTGRGCIGFEVRDVIIQLIDGRIVGPTKPKDWSPCVRDFQRAGEGA